MYKTTLNNTIFCHTRPFDQVVRCGISIGYGHGGGYELHIIFVTTLRDIRECRVLLTWFHRGYLPWEHTPSLPRLTILSARRSIFIWPQFIGFIVNITNRYHNWLVIKRVSSNEGPRRYLVDPARYPTHSHFIRWITYQYLRVRLRHQERRHRLTAFG